MLLLIVFLSIAILLVLTCKCKPYLHKKKINVRRSGRVIKVDDVDVEYADLQHYIDTEKEFEARKTMYDRVIEPVIVIVNDAVDVRVPEIIQHHIDIDTQNVHDNTIQKNLKTRFSRVLKINQPFESLRDEIVDSIDDDTKAEKVSHILDMIQKRDAYITNLGSNEVDVIKNVWFSGTDNVKTQMINELLDCVDISGSLYCPTGVTSRVASSLHIDNPDNYPKTKDMLNQEVMEKFGYNFNKIADKTLSKNKTIDDYYGVYDREVIEGLIDAWIDHV